MSKYAKEILIGIIPVIFAFLFYINVNIVPLIMVTAFVAALYFMTKSRTGSVGVASGSKNRGKSPGFMTFDDIGGQDSAKKELVEALDFLIKHEEIKKFGIRPLKGILLTGPPGTGKTLLAKASAHYTNSVFMSASGSEFVEMYVGVGASRIRDLFKEARSRAEKEKKDSAIIFIDEIDVIGGKRDGGQQREYDQTLNQLLTEMDGMHTSQSPRILIVGATNRKEMLDSALLRPGRFDRHIQVDLPDKKGRLHILNIHAKNKPLAENVNLDRIAQEAFQFSGAQLESLMNEAAIYAMRDSLDLIQQSHLSRAVDKVLMGEKTDRESTMEEKERVALHELGHAIAAEVVRPGSVSQVALSPRGQALGYVRHNPQQDQYLYTKDHLEGQIMIALGGAAAEEIFYNSRSTGSRNDFEQSVNMVRTMIDCGLTKLGIVNPDVLNKDEYSKETTAILDELFGSTKMLLERYRSVFDQSLSILMKEEVLSGDQFRELLEQTRELVTA
ncbi:ATPase [Paenibacillus swuensis]|uniref:ATPase n=1 Tax=Paenibacillus swuensis TaxID=1178515 RepID=A0A172TLM8_9BACL|nr:AAA family ATPase [Paenibacillus swuensis]ANE47930.1 ATPase [Paenibacillus swuensis]